MNLKFCNIASMADKQGRRRKQTSNCEGRGRDRRMFLTAEWRTLRRMEGEEVILSGEQLHAREKE
ncbi:hypothetical protein TSUD_261130 [Trifolium subterraneum]|uniref:Uncharacterized protein n=1 Tax=Trifolium subterraneum TaxID=3900 RepID=A0A2Z6LY01_TRISU|nr:hypothetical protein TSUD_261130 [Trifolium subterraneum]